MLASSEICTHPHLERAFPADALVRDPPYILENGPCPTCSETRSRSTCNTGLLAYRLAERPQQSHGESYERQDELFSGVSELSQRLPARLSPDPIYRVGPLALRLERLPGPKDPALMRGCGS